MDIYILTFVQVYWIIHRIGAYYSKSCISLRSWFNFLGKDSSHRLYCWYLHRQKADNNKKSI